VAEIGLCLLKLRPTFSLKDNHKTLLKFSEILPKDSLTSLESRNQVSANLNKFCGSFVITEGRPLALVRVPISAAFFFVEGVVGIPAPLVIERPTRKQLFDIPNFSEK
jgi:hypothetical protein